MTELDEALASLGASVAQRMLDAPAGETTYCGGGVTVTKGRRSLSDEASAALTRAVDQQSTGRGLRPLSDAPALSNRSVNYVAPPPFVITRTIARRIRQGDETYCLTCSRRWPAVDDGPPCDRCDGE